MFKLLKLIYVFYFIWYEWNIFLICQWQQNFTNCYGVFLCYPWSHLRTRNPAHEALHKFATKIPKAFNLSLKLLFLYLFLFKAANYASLEIYIIRIFSLVIFIFIIAGNLENGLKSAEIFASPFLDHSVFSLTRIFICIKGREKEEICTYCFHITHA